VDKSGNVLFDPIFYPRDCQPFFECPRPLTMHSGVTESSKSKVAGLAVQKLSKLKRQLGGDLDNIVLKALRKEPVRRYASVEQLAEDIRQHLQGLPVMATPDSVWYRFSKFVLRHKAGVAAIALIALAVTGGVAATLWEARIAVRERARAESRFNDVRKLANFFLFEFDDAIKNLPGSTPARSLVVKRALEYLDGLAADARGNRSLQMEIAFAYKRVGEVQGDPMFPNLGDSKGALQSSKKALAILEALSLAEPLNQQVRLALASTHQQISDVLDFSGDTAGAVEHSGEALKVYEGLAGNLAGDSKFQSERVTLTYQYADLLKSVGRLDEAASLYRQAVELSQQMIAANSFDREAKFHLATSLDGLGNTLQEKGDSTGALENRRRGMAIREELVRLDPNDSHYRRQLAFSHHNVGLSLVEAGDLGSALSQFRQELSLFESLSAADPKDVQGQRNQSLAHKQIGDVLMRSGDVRRALAHYRATLAIDRGLALADPGNSQAVLDLSFSEGKVGSALGKLGQTSDASTILRSGVTRQESLIAKDPHHILLYNHLANSYTRLANFLLDQKNQKAAIEYYRKAVAARLTLAQKSPDSSTNRRALAECYMNLAKALGVSDRDNAMKQYSNGVELLEQLAGADRNNAQYRIALADALSNTARLYVSMAAGEPAGRLQYWSKAKSYYQRSQELWLELDKAGKVPAARGGAIREVSEELARCNDSTAKLGQVR
jgi:eukaryotic-like serine/threonine-protein kinase